MDKSLGRPGWTVRVTVRVDTTSDLLADRHILPVLSTVPDSQSGVGTTYDLVVDVGDSLEFRTGLVVPTPMEAPIHQAPGRLPRPTAGPLLQEECVRFQSLELHRES